MTELDKIHESYSTFLNAGFPIGRDLLDAISKKEQDYLFEEILPKYNEQIKELLADVRNDVDFQLSYSPDDGLKVKEKSIHVMSYFEDEAPNERDRTMYSINGGEPLNKRRFVLEVVKMYVQEHPNVSLMELELRFPSSIHRSKANGVVRRYDDVMRRVADHPNLAIRFFLNPEDLIQLSDGTKVTVHNQWGGEEFDNFLRIARSLFEIS
ncbi:MAG: hypothetical protein IJ607_04965 [Bacteroidaceae bacterium]|nr:hypothetical protein [Bacteroidaceae bacterium]